MPRLKGGPKEEELLKFPRVENNTAIFSPPEKTSIDGSFIIYIRK